MADGSSAGAQFDRRQFRVRIAIVLALSLGAAVVPSAGDNRFWVSALLVLVVWPAHYVIRHIAGRPNPTGWLDLLAVLAASAMAAIEPDVWNAALLFQMLNVGGAVAFLPQRWTAILGGVAVSTMATVAAIRPVDNPVPMLVVVAVFLPALIAGASRRNARERRSTGRVDAIVASLPVLIWESRAEPFDIDSVVGRPEHVLGHRLDEIVGPGLDQLVVPEDRDRRRRALEAGQGAVEYRVRRPEGTTIWLRDQLRREETERGEVLRGVTTDISETREQRARLERQDEIVRRMSALVLVLDDPVAGPDAHLRQVDDNISWIDRPIRSGERFGDAVPELAGHPRISAACAGLGPVESIEIDSISVTDRRGVGRHVQVELFGLPDGAAALLVEDVTERETAMAHVRHQATHDALTGLANRSRLMETVDRRIGDGGDITLLLIDLDNFKDVNDTLGHYTGDELLKILSLRLRNSIRGADLVARLGGDEFAVAVPHTDAGELDILIGRILAKLREKVVVDGATLAPGASIGVASAPLHATDAESLLRCADVAMYEAKRTRVGFWHYGPSMQADPSRLQLSAELREALALGELTVHLQPVVSLRTGLVRCAEVLVRWEHPTRGLLLPKDFLDLVHVAGLDSQLVEHVLSAGVAAAARLPDDVDIAVNVSAADLRRPELPDLIDRILLEHEVEPTRLEIELTESEIIDDTGVVGGTLATISDLGVQIAIDDFGTGYSSFARLRELPLDRLKIDRRFVHGMIDHEHDDVIVRSMIDLAENMGLRTTAEGVETVAQQRLLAELGCEDGQGFLYGRPQPLAELQRTIDRLRLTT
ncbi:MAG: EAL domain-containing protein [Actinomycetota bacterium]